MEAVAYDEAQHADRWGRLTLDSPAGLSTMRTSTVGTDEDARPMTRESQPDSDHGSEPVAATPQGSTGSAQRDDQAPGRPSSADIFISYSRKDIAFAHS